MQVGKARDRYFVALYVVTSGLQGDSLGTDEEEITWLSYAVIDVRKNEVIARRQYIVKPSYMAEDFFSESDDHVSVDNDATSDDEQPVAESLVSEAALALAPTLTEQIIRKHGIPLEQAIADFEEYFRKLGVRGCVELVVHGQAPLRQCLYPEARKKFIRLPIRYSSFFDLKKEFSTCYSKQQKLQMDEIQQMMQLIDLPANTQLPVDCHVGEAVDMVSLIQRMIADGHAFREPEQIVRLLIPSLPVEHTTDDCVVLVRGLGWPLLDWEVARFFAGLNIRPGGVVLRLRAQSRRLGEALVCFESKEHRDMALGRHQHFFGQLCVEVHEASSEEFVSISRCQIIVMISGLPMDFTAEVVQFFATGDEPCRVLDAEEGVLFVKSGELVDKKNCLVLFADEEEAARALGKQMVCVDGRSFTPHRFTTHLAQHLLNRSCTVKSEDRFLLPNKKPPPPDFVRHNDMPDVTVCEQLRVWIHLDNLPLKASVADILQFFGDDICKYIVQGGIHMVFCAPGAPAGEAFVEMKNESAAHECAKQCTYRQMNFGGKFHCIVAEQRNGIQMKTKLRGNVPCIPFAVPMRK